jgi:ornithine cyclodeaminase/alanine dehydrogenase-like protein (mu-crystallin family)
MSNNISVLFISQEELLETGCFNMNMAIDIAEQALIDYANGYILFPDKVSQIFNEVTQDRINCLPATLLKQKICGMKWVSVFPGNPVKFGLQNVTACIILSNIENGFPLTYMEGTLCSNMRTAAVSSIAAKYLAKGDSKSIGFIGAGEQAKMHLVGMKTVFPQLEVCKVASRTTETERCFINDLSQLYPDLKFISCNSLYEAAATDSDIIVTAISAQLPILQSEWIKKGAFYCHVGGWEDDYAVPLKANKIVCDDWNSVKHRTQTISRLYKYGKLKDADIYGDLHEIVTQKKMGRTNNEEFIYFNAVGLSYVDVALAHEMYCLVLNKGRGKKMILQSKKLFDYDLGELSK